MLDSGHLLTNGYAAFPRNEVAMEISRQTQDMRDLQWIREIQRGDAAACAALFRVHYVSLRDFAWRYVESADVAEELVQDLFLHIWEHRGGWEPRGTVRSYLYRAIHNRSLNHLKRRRIAERWQALPPPDASPESPADVLHYNELSGAVRATLDALPERRRLVFVLSRQYGMTYAEIAEMLGISVKTVETQISRTLTALRSRLNAYLLPG